MIEIDGSLGEGGGQVLRTTLSVSCVSGKAVRIRNIRAGRSQPGLKAQHLAVCRLLAGISGARMEGAAIGSQEIIFEPANVPGGEFSFDIGTAGSCTLLLQAALPVLLHSGQPCTLRAMGGTHVAHAPTFEYFSEVFLPAAREFGAKCKAELVKPGFYPKGGGEISISTMHSELRGVAFHQQAHERVRYSIISALLPRHVVEREEEKMKALLAGKKLEGEAKVVEACCPGNAVTLWGGFFGASALGEQRKSAESVAQEACDAFIAETLMNAAVDSHLADQLLLYAALAKGKTSYRASKATRHLETNAEILRVMTGRNIRLGADGNVQVE